MAGHSCDLHSPPDPLPGRAVVYLHGIDEPWLRECTELRDLVEAARLPVIAPRAERSWWIDRIVPAFDARLTPERFVVDHVRAEVERRFGATPPGIAVIGTGMGGQAALRLAYRHPQVFPVAAAVAPAIDFHLAMRDAGDHDEGGRYDALWQAYGDVERARQDTAILHVHPLNWPRHQFFASDPADEFWHDGAARLHDKLAALGIPHVARLDAPLDTAVPELMRFVTAALDAEARRPAPC